MIVGHHASRLYCPAAAFADNAIYFYADDTANDDWSMDNRAKKFADAKNIYAYRSDISRR